MKEIAMSDEVKKPEIKLVESAPEDIFNDLENLRHTATLKVTRRVVTTNIKVRKPPNNVYFRSHPDPAMSLDASVITDGEVFYFVTPFMLNHPIILPRLRKVTIATVCTWPGGEISLWPVPMAGETRIACWKSARAAYDHSKTQWVQICWNADTRDYDVAVADGIAAGPMWPDDLNFQKNLKLGFSDRIINSPDHPYAKQLRGIAD
jgi:hypothetical protein